MKMFKRILSGMMAFLMVFGLVAAAAPEKAHAENETLTAYLAYADSAWGDAQFWGDTSASPAVKATMAEVTGYGQYTVALDFTGTEAGAAKGLEFAAVMINDGELVHPNAIISIDQVVINGEAVEVGVGYTSSDDKVVTRYNLYNAWVGSLPDDARNISGDLSQATPTSLPKEAGAEVKTIEVTFTYSAGCTAYIDFANPTWDTQIWTGSSENGITAVIPEVTGEGTYTTSLDFTGTANGFVDGVAFTALMLGRGDVLFPGYALKLESVEINGEAVEVGKYYTTSDNGIDTRINLYNEWCGHDENGVIVPKEPNKVERRHDGDLEGITPMPLDKDLFNGVETFSVTFSLVPAATRVYAEPSAEWPTTAYLAFADGAWGDAQFWGDETASPAVKATMAEVTGFGQYTVGVDFTGTANGKAAGAAAFTSVMVKGLEQIAPGACLTVDKIEINGAEVSFGTSYTSSDDGVETRSNLFNAWVSELPKDARTASGSLEDATPTPLTTEQLTDVQTMYVTFTISPYTTAYISYVDESWGVQYWGGAPEGGITVNSPVIYKPGTYTASIDFTGTAAGSVNGVSFAGLMLDRGEIAFPYAILNIDEIKVNGEAITFTPGYTTTDDKATTRVNLYNAWVNELPEDVRTADGSKEVSAQIVDPAVLTGVKTIEITFTFIEGEAPVVVEVEKPVYTADKDGVYHAYLLLQTENWSFRNKYSDGTYGKESNPEAFAQISTVQDGTLAVKQGTIADAEIKGNGTYTVSLTDFNFEDESTLFNILGISTDIPDDEEIVFSNVKVKLDGKTVYTFDEGFRDPDDAKLGLITILAVNKWNNSLTADYGFSYNFPTKTIELEFTVSGFNYDLAAEGTDTPEPTQAPEPTDEAEPTQAPEPTKEAEPTKAPEPTKAEEPTKAPAADVTTDTVEGGSNVVIIVIVVLVVVAVVAGGVVFFLKKKNNK
ncbi:MAG: hypothetical protein ACI4FZ_12720 [Lachnospiraceae bacterium]